MKCNPVSKKNTSFGCLVCGLQSIIGISLHLCSSASSNMQVQSCRGAAWCGPSLRRLTAHACAGWRCRRACRPGACAICGESKRCVTSWDVVVNFLESRYDFRSCPFPLYSVRICCFRIPVDFGPRSSSWSSRWARSGIAMGFISIVWRILVDWATFSPINLVVDCFDGLYMSTSILFYIFYIYTIKVETIENISHQD